MHDDNYSINVAQAQLFADSLAVYVDSSSALIEAAEAKLRHARATHSSKSVREYESQVRQSRLDLYDIYRQLDRLVARFPEVTVREN